MCLKISSSSIFNPNSTSALKDDKNYPYIKITNDPFPRLQITRNPVQDGAQYFGPYPSIGSSRYLLRLLYDLFPLRDCTQDITLDKKQLKCLNLDIGKCIGPCIYKSIKPEYDTLINQLKLVLQGKNTALISKLNDDMKDAANQKYELAASIRDRIQKLERLANKQTVDTTALPKEAHFIAYEENNYFYYVLIQEFHNGKLLYQHGRFIGKDSSLSGKEFLIQSLAAFYTSRNAPSALLLGEHIEHDVKTALNANFAHYITPIRGDKATILKRCQENAKQAIIRLQKNHFESKFNTKKALDLLKKDLNLPATPLRIIGFDISHYYGNDIVASAVYFKNGKPEKSLYRHFKITSIKTGKAMMWKPCTQSYYAEFTAFSNEMKHCQI